MTSRKCIIKDCDSEDGHEGITFHRFPTPKGSNAEHIISWRKACKIESGFKPNKHHYVCSQHFRRENFSILSSGKIILKPLTVPSIFPWNKDNVKITKSTITISDPESPSKKKKDDKTKEKDEEKPMTETESSNEEKKDPEEIDIASTPIKNDETIKTESQKKKNSNNATKKKISSDEKKTAVVESELSPTKPKKSSKQLSARYQALTETKKLKLEQIDPPSNEKKETKPVKTSKIKEEPKSDIPSSSQTVSSSTSSSSIKSNAINFVPGNSIEVKNFDGKWVSVKIIEVDMDEREVFVKSSEKNKSKPGLNDEWISMDSPRLRPAQPAVTFEIGEKVLARWNDCRKFSATIQRVLENDTYDVLFDDGYPKIVRGVHIQKFNAKTAAKTQVTEAPPPALPINPLLLNPPSLLPDYIKEMKDELPSPLTGENGEWCCVWVDDIPVGEESSFDGTFGKCPSIIIPDTRLKEGWQKHIYLRQNGKWDVLFISPTNRKLRFKNELKIYLIEIGEIYDPNVWDFSLHKKLSKAKNMCIQSDKMKKHQVMSTSFDGKESVDSPVFNPFANLGALPYVQPNLVQALPTQNEVSVGSLKVKVIDNNYHCPDEKCDKTFRKENHLQIHIKHYHPELAKLMGECPNMEDLAYLRTTVDDTEIAMVKSNRKSHGPKEGKSKPKADTQNSIRDFSIQIEKLDPDYKFNIQKSPILEEALKAPLITTNIHTPSKDAEIKKEKEFASSPIQQFDPETLIPPHAVLVSRSNMKAHKRKMRIRFNPKSKKSNSKKRYGYYPNKSDATGSTVEGVIPYHEGPYFKNQHPSSYVDENGEVIKIVRMKKEEIINCICGFGEEDGLMIQCDLCLCWQHGICHNIEKSHQVPEKHVCYICKNPYRQRLSTRFMHDQDWLYDGKLPIANYHVENPKQAARFDTLKECHTLIGNLIEMKKFMHSLDVKINIAENSEHPKLYLWAKKWEESPPREKSSDSDCKDNIKLEEDVKMPLAPEPEAAIEPKKCQQTLLDHIEFQQNNVKSRLDMIENEITALEEEVATKIPNGKKPIDDATLKSTIYMLIKDLKQINNFADIHRNPLPEEEL
ncbi:hypothetical protein PVAND_006893 [Polypedilum vanderplanki]|uniref:Uncharacterized protein n=1 Tax=Polypedilum vanderplanki TaxID=319348 RepID=A0A9J6C680_POLVA|nr:hypothetical protein PVAND_006893 [Polypedilum vanderplanki]